MPRRHVNARPRVLGSAALSPGGRVLELFWLEPWKYRAIGQARRWTFDRAS